MIGRFLPILGGFAAGVCFMAGLGAIAQGSAAPAAILTLFASVNIGLAIWRAAEQ